MALGITTVWKNKKKAKEVSLEEVEGAVVKMSGFYRKTKRRKL